MTRCPLCARLIRLSRHGTLPRHGTRTQGCAASGMTPGAAGAIQVAVDEMKGAQ